MINSFIINSVTFLKKKLRNLFNWYTIVNSHQDMLNFIQINLIRSNHSPMIAWKTSVRFQTFQSNQTEMYQIDFGRLTRSKKYSIESHSRFKVGIFFVKFLIIISSHIPSVLNFRTFASGDPSIDHTRRKTSDFIKLEFIEDEL